MQTPQRSGMGGGAGLVVGWGRGGGRAPSEPACMWPGRAECAVSVLPPGPHGAMCRRMKSIAAALPPPAYGARPITAGATTSAGSGSAGSAAPVPHTPVGAPLAGGSFRLVTSPGVGSGASLNAFLGASSPSTLLGGTGASSLGPVARSSPGAPQLSPVKVRQEFTIAVGGPAWL